MEQKKFEILKRQTQIEHSQRDRHRFAMFTGLCFLGAAASLFAKNPELLDFQSGEFGRLFQVELDSLFSYEALLDYFKELGPGTVIFTGGSVNFLRKYFKSNKKICELQREIDMINENFPDEYQIDDEENIRTR